MYGVCVYSRKRNIIGSENLWGQIHSGTKLLKEIIILEDKIIVKPISISFRI